MRALGDRPSRAGVLKSVRVALLAAALGVLAALAFPPASMGHSERETFFPDPNEGAFPVYRTSGPSHVVCRPGSRQRIEALQDQALRERNLRLLARCQFSDIQAAVDAAQNGDRILVLPGVYKELPSRGPAPPGCEDVYTRTANGDFALSYEEHVQCPHAQNLIAILGDTNGNRICDSKCNIQIEGTGARPGDVEVKAERSRLNVIRADRADGVFLRNFRVELSDFNNIYVLETNGFRISHVVSLYSREYGILSFTSDHGIYEYCDTSYNGDSGIYPGSGPDARHGHPDAHGHVYGIRIHHCNSHHNTIGYSGTAGNGIHAYNNRLHHNATGLTTDSFASGHPGMPQDSSQWSRNLVYSNNNNLFSDDRDAYCQNTPPAERDPKLVCPTFQVPVGTGLLIAGGNNNITTANYIFDNWRNGTMLFWVPASLRGEQDSAKNYDTSSNNRYRGNCMGRRPADINNPDFSICTGTRDPNGTDFWWDEEEGQDCDPDQAGCVDTETKLGNCWSDNVGLNAGEPSSDPAALPLCPGSDLFKPGLSSKQAPLVPCATWNPVDNTDPPGCDWFTTPPEPH